MQFPRMFVFMLTAAIAICATASAQQDNQDLRKTSLNSSTPSDEIVRIDVDKDGKPDIIERWWNGKRVRWMKMATSWQLTPAAIR